MNHKKKRRAIQKGEKIPPRQLKAGFETVTSICLYLYSHQDCEFEGTMQRPRSTIFEVFKELAEKVNNLKGAKQFQRHFIDGGH